MSKAHRELAPTARQVYGTNPAEYDAGRPDYPDRIYEVLAERCGLRDGSRVLEIGPGSGTATRHLLAVGAEVVAVEPNAALGSYLGETNPGQRLRVIQSTFEDAELEDGCFDLVTAATSFHWVDPESGFAKLGRVVRPGGWVAVWWTIFGDSTRPDPFPGRDAIADCRRDEVVPTERTRRPDGASMDHRAEPADVRVGP